jgi:hypothetical protein
MARVRFTHDYDYKPTAQCTVGYKAGMEKTVKRDCADKAIAAGKATSLEQGLSAETADEGQS